MTAKQKKLFLLTSMMSVFVMAAAVLFAGGKFSLSPFGVRGNGEESTVTFTRADEYSVSGTTFTYKKSTPSGNDVYLVSTGGINRASSSALASVPSTYESTYTQLYMKFYKDSGATSGFMHQKINSLTIKTSNTLTVKIKTSSDGISFINKSDLECSSAGATFEGFADIDRYICLTVDSRAASTRSITEISFVYECDSSKSHPSVESAYSSVVKDTSNRDSAVRMIFNSDGYGRFTFYNNTYLTDYITNYRWEYIPSMMAVKIYYVSEPPAGASISGKSTGTASQYQQYCLFIRYNKDYGFYNYVSIFDGKISLVFHTTINTSLTNPDVYYNYNQRTDITTLSAE